MARHGNTITISSNGVLLNELQYDGQQLVDPQTAGVRGAYVPTEVNAEELL